MSAGVETFKVYEFSFNENNNAKSVMSSTDRIMKAVGDNPGIHEGA